MNITKQIRAKLDEAEGLYTQIFKIEKELIEIINNEIQKTDSDLEIDTDVTVDYFNYVMNKQTDTAELMILRDLINAKLSKMD